jgi:hypothetical protein
MGTERATDVTPGGDREYGAFGQAQSEFIAVLNDPDTNSFAGDPHYGQWLQDYFFIV